MNGTHITSDDLVTLTGNLEAYIRRLKDESQNKKRLASDLKKEADTLRRRRSQEVAVVSRAAVDNNQVQGAMVTIQRQYDKMKDEKVDAARTVESDVSDVDRSTKEAEDLLRELKKYEQGIRDYELNVRPWVEKAGNLLRNAGAI